MTATIAIACRQAPTRHARDIIVTTPSSCRNTQKLAPDPRRASTRITGYDRISGHASISLRPSRAKRTTSDHAGRGHHRDTGPGASNASD
jgi:hypothetical protein